MNEQRDLSFWKLWNLSFGFFGVQIAYALQSSQVSRIFSTIGADPHDLSYFWILPPLMGLIVQPIVGSASDRTWNRMGRRLPYLFFGALVAIIVMCLLPNAGSLGLGISHAILFGLVMLMLLDTSINMAMQPFKMLVGDMVNEKQKGLAYSIQSFLCNAGSVVGYIAPFVLAWFLSNTAPAGQVPPTVTWAFYIGAFILGVCVLYTFVKVKEMPPHEYALFHGIKEQHDKEAQSEGMFKLLVKAPKVFWTVGIVQFFCWAAFLYMWTYSTDAVALQAFNAPSMQTVTGITINGQQYNEKNIFNDKQPVILDGKVALAGIDVDGTFVQPDMLVANGDTIIANGKILAANGVDKVEMDKLIIPAGSTVIIDGAEVTVSRGISTVSSLSLVAPGTSLTLAHIANLDNGTGEYLLDETSATPAVNSPEEIALNYKTVLNPATSEYQNAGDWNGNLFAIQAIAAVLWAVVLAGFKRRRLAYSLSLAIGAIGFLSVYFIHSPYWLAISYALMGCAWAAILAMPFTILTNALSGGNIGTYLGLFNCTITVPQIVAALCGGAILHCFPAAENGAPFTVGMLMVSGVLLAIGCIAVWNIKETFGSKASE